MLLMTDPIFCDPIKDKTLPVIELGSRPTKLDKNHFYLIGDIIYEFVGYVEVGNMEPGTIGQIGERFYIEPHLEENEEIYNRKYIISKKYHDDRTIMSGSLEEMITNYCDNYRSNNNLIKSGNIKIVPTGEVFMPVLDQDDDPLERVIKLMLRHMKLVLNDYRHQFGKKHALDNIKSALNGQTKNMSILKFLTWCDIFDLKWEVMLVNSSYDVPKPLESPIIIYSDKPYPWEDIPPETKEIFTVPLRDGEDPLKRGIKLALGDKNICLKDYKHKCPSPHLLNNMKSALKSPQKMTVPYFINWCEIIDLTYSIKVISKDGIWYKLTGFDMSTNDKEIE